MIVYILFHTYILNIIDNTAKFRDRAHPVVKYYSKTVYI